MGMTCGTCGEANRDRARFCAACGDRLTARCSTCDAELATGARFCDSCGAPVMAGASTPLSSAGDQVRKTVTIVFVDLVGSTATQEDMDPESVRAFTDRYYALMREAIEAAGGRVVKFVGDGVMAIFGVPEVAEDDALRAIRAAATIRDAFAPLADEVRMARGVDLALRIGVNTGEVVVDPSDADVVGDDVNVASRLESAAPPGEILVGESTCRLTRAHAVFGEAMPLQVRGRVEPVVARTLVSIGSPAGRDAGRTAFVGRDAELERLVAALDTAVASGRSQLVTVLGSPGVGKSRLLDELAVAVRDRAAVLSGRCDVASTATYAPVADVVRAAVDAAGSREALLFEDSERERVEAGIGFLVGDAEPGTPEQTFWSVRRVIEAVAHQQPAIVVLDDLHWAEPLLLDLTEHLAEWLTDQPVVIIAAARPELRELRPSLVDAGRAAAVISLEGLDPSATARLATELVGSGGLPSVLVARIVAATEGNPLFVRELVRMLVDEGVLRAEGDRWVLTVDPAEVEVPPTITSLLAARIDRLRADERTVLERASVIGHEVVRGALVELLAESPLPLDVVLESLRRKELLEPAGTYWIDEPVLRFHHALIRDAAYRRLLKGARAELHERTAAWVAAKTGGGPEHDELIGFHLEQAQANRRELGSLDDHGQEVARRAAARLAGAAHRALHQDDLPAAATLSGRALACLDPGDPSRTELLLLRCEALLGTGDVTAAGSAVDELSTIGSRDDRIEAWATAFRVQLATLTGTVDLEDGERLARDAADRLAAMGDPTGAAKAHRVHASVLARRGRVADTEAALDRALTAARTADDRRQISGVLAAAPLAALWGPSPVPRAGGRCLDVVRLLRITTGARSVEAISTRCQAVLEAFRGRHDAARKMLGSARRALEDLGLTHGLLELELFAGIVELAADEPAAAEEHLRAAHDGFRALGNQVDASQAAALRARAALTRDRVEDALALADAAETLGGTDLKTAIAWRSVKAEVLARQGDHEAAHELARAAVALAAPTDALVDHADALAALARVLDLTGDAEGARRAGDSARALYERKGATALAARLGPAEVAREPATGAEPQTQPDPIRESLAVRSARALGAALFEQGVSAAAELDRAAGPVDNAAVAYVRREKELVVSRDPTSLRESVSPFMTGDDRRRGLTSSMHDRDAYVELGMAIAKVGVTITEVECLATRGDRLALVRQTFEGESGFLATLLAIAQVDDRGRLLRIVSYDDDEEGSGAARMTLDHWWEERDRFNSAVAGQRWATQRMLDGQWDRLEQGIHPHVVSHDRRAGVPSVLDGQGLIENSRLIIDVGARAIDVEGLAVRGDHLAVARCTYRGGTDSDDYLASVLVLLEMSDDDRVVGITAFDEDELDDAIAELERRAAEPCNRATWAARWGNDRWAAREWDVLRSSVHPDFTAEDRRSGALMSYDLETHLENLKAIADVGAAHVQNETIAVEGDLAALMMMRFASDQDDHFLDTLGVLVLDEEGRARRLVSFGPEDRDAALEELARCGPTPEPAGTSLTNHATEASARWRQAYRDGRLADLDALVSPTHHYVDRRRVVGGALVVEGGSGAQTGQDLRAIGVRDVRSRTLATRGDRFALEHDVYVGGDYQGEVLQLVEVDLDGRMALGLTFDVDAIDAAYDELDARYLASLPVAAAEVAAVPLALMSAWNRGDRIAVDRILSPDIVLRDHRGIGFGEFTGRAPEELFWATGVYRLDEVVALGSTSALGRLRFVEQSEDGAEVELATLTLALVRDGRLVGMEYFDEADVDTAMERFNEVDRGRRPGPTRGAP